MDLNVHAVLKRKTHSSTFFLQFFILLNTGPAFPSRYIPGTPGGRWSKEDIHALRDRINKVIDPREDRNSYLSGLGKGAGHQNKPVSEVAMLRLAFHDCLTYTDGTGGCDGKRVTIILHDPICDNLLFVTTRLNPSFANISK